MQNILKIFNLKKIYLELYKYKKIEEGRDVKKICTRGYLQIKPATGRKWILKMDTRYPRVWVFLIPAC